MVGEKSEICRKSRSVNTRQIRGIVWRQIVVG